LNAERIIILNDVLQQPRASTNTAIVNYTKLISWIKRGIFLLHLLRYKEARLLTYRLDVLPNPFLTAVFLRLLSRKTCFLDDEQGRSMEITVALLFKLLYRCLKDLHRRSGLISKVEREIMSLAASNDDHSKRVSLNISARPVYLRTDLWFGVRSGGSVGHTAGVLNQLDRVSGKPIFLATAVIPTVRDDLEVHYISPDDAFWDFRELPTFYFNDAFESDARKLLSGEKLSFIYQRYSLNNYTGVKLSRYYNIPFVLEYNGSEIWIHRKWMRRLKYESLSERIELLNLKGADVVVVVSQVMKDELVARGIHPQKILVNPNGVDPEKYNPEIDGSRIRRTYNLSDKDIVVGFIGTFGPWHGAEVLVEAFGKLIQAYPAYRNRVRLLMIGDGVKMGQVKEQVVRFALEEVCILTGLVDQNEGPSYLAACDTFVSPHVPNPDGTPFFGSPTKLFEYMAMGKGIVASDLEQIGEVLEHGATAWLVIPGDVASLTTGLKTLIDDEELRHRLGIAARREAVAKYTWQEHTKRIIERLEEQCG
jgi:glycosyltransferase involved in cell wall biosynthesis